MPKAESCQPNPGEPETSADRAESPRRELWEHLHPEAQGTVENDSVVIILPDEPDHPPVWVYLYDTCAEKERRHRQAEVLDDLRFPGVRVLGATSGSKLGRHLLKRCRGEAVRLTPGSLDKVGTIGYIAKNNDEFLGAA